MKCTLSLCSIFISMALFAQNPAPQAVPMPSPAAPAASPTAPMVVKEKEFVMEFKHDAMQSPRLVDLQIDIPDSDVTEYGFQKSAIQTEIATRLALAQIQIKSDTDLPKLVLRVKSIQADRAIATFVQLSYVEEVTLVRTKGRMFSPTWSQATLISGPKEELTKEVTQTIISMVNSFILTYNKAMMPAA